MARMSPKPKTVKRTSTSKSTLTRSSRPPPRTKKNASARPKHTRR